MAGKDCVAIAADCRFGQQLQTVGCNMQKIFELGDRLFLGMSGLATDIQTVSQKLQYKCNIYKLREEREVQPEVFSNLLSHTLYERRFGPYFINPIVAGLTKDGQPFLRSTDLIGAQEKSTDFAVIGTADESLAGVCEALWRPDMDESDLFETISQCLLNAMDRDCLSGWGAIVHVITKEGVTTRRLKTRMD